MATNQEIWGQSSDWSCPVSTMSGSDNNMKPLVGYFGEAPSSIYPAGCLFSGIYHDIFPTINGNMFTNEPIDNTISYCGLGSESVWSKVQYYMVGSTTTQSLVIADNRNVTNFAFCESQGSYSGLFQNNNTDANQKRGNRDRWSPMGYNTKELNPSAANTNSNRRVQPYVQLPVRNMILTATLRVARSLVEDRASTSGMDLANVPLWDYIDTSKQRNYTTHPYIIAISIQPYMLTTNGADNIDPVTGAPPAGTVRSSTNIYSGISLLSPLSYADGVESDAGNPGNVLGEVYSYYWSKSPSRLTGIWIFGTSTSGYNDNDYIRQLSTDEVTGQLRWVLPHPYAEMRSMAQTNDYGWYYLEYYDNGGDDNLVHWIMEQMACFGLFFTIDKTTAQTGTLTAENMCLGILENGIGHGRWTTGEENMEQEQWEWDTTNSSSYKPHDDSGGGGDDPYGDVTSFIKAGSGINPGGKWYADSNLGVWNGLLAWCNNLSLDGEDKLDPSYFFGQNPIDCIIEAKYIFVNDYTFGKTMGTSGPITLGSYNNGGVNSHPFSTSHPVEFDCGYVDITRPWEDFRDYDPYTTISLILPFSDSIDLPTDIFMGHRCTLTELIDPLTGDLIYYVFVDNILYTSLTGNCAMSLSINGLETATYAQTRFSLQTQATVARYNALSSLVGGAAGASIAANLANPVGAFIQGLGGLVNFAGSAYQAKRYEDQFSRTAPPPAKIQKASSNVQWGSMPVPHIVVASPLMADGYTDANYKEQTGFATYKVGKIGDEKGYVVCSSINPSGLSCSKEETEMITNLLTQGIYIK